MATTIDRSGITPTNDTGTPASPVGDGTLINAAFFALVYDEIDQLFNGTTANPFVFGARLQVDGFGTHAFDASSSGANELRVRNSHSGTASYSRLSVGNDTSASAATLSAHSSTYTGFSDTCALVSSLSGGLVLHASHASGVLSLATNGLTRVYVDASGRVLIGGTPSAADAALEVRRSVTLGVGADGVGLYSKPTFVEAGSGTHTSLIANHFDVPSITDNAAATTSAYNVYIAGAPSVGTNKYALYVASGESYIGGTLTLGMAAGFLAYNSVSDTVTVFTDTTIDFDTESYDDGGVFASDTFTAPASGRYLLTACVSVINNEGATRAVVVRFKTSSGIDYYFGGETLAASGGNASITGSVVINLAASETVVVALNPGGSGSPNLTINGPTSGDAQTWFSGRRLL